jgi:transcriptional regulator with XRE-family HTH domain
MSTDRDRTIGKRIARIRQQRLMTQGYLGEAIGVSKHAVYHFENGHRRITAEHLERLAVALHCGVAGLLAPVEAPIPRISPIRARKAPKAPIPWRGVVANDNASPAKEMGGK